RSGETTRWTTAPSVKVQDQSTVPGSLCCRCFPLDQSEFVESQSNTTANAQRTVDIGFKTLTHRIFYVARAVQAICLGRHRRQHLYHCLTMCARHAENHLRLLA